MENHALWRVASASTLYFWVSISISKRDTAPEPAAVRSNALLSMAALMARSWEDVSVDISYLTPNGQGNVTKTETIPANSRKTFNMASHSGMSGRAAIEVTSKTSGKKIMCERAMYWNSRGAGTDTIGGYGDN